MKIKIAILGSTGSIGKSLIDIIKKDRKKFEVILLTAKKNHKELLKQAKLLKVKNLIITNKKAFEFLKKKKINQNVKIFNNYKNLNSIFRKKIDYVMSSISGINGLQPTLDIIKHTKKLLLPIKNQLFVVGVY